MSGKTVITGGASGIGLATAGRLLEEGGAVCLLDRSADALEAAKARLSSDRVTAAAADVRDHGALEKAIRAGAEAMSGLTGCVASAGIGYRVPILDSETPDFAHVISVNLTGVYSTLRSAALVMVENGTAGSLVSLASVAGVRGCAERAAYGAAKAGVINLTQTAALEFAKHGIRANALCPAPIETPLIEAFSPEVRSDWMGTIPMRRFGTPEEVADLAAFLLSDRAAYITGQAIGVDGGWMGTGLQSSNTRIPDRSA